MSIYRSYFDKSNTLIYNSYTNTARNPIVELFYGRVNNLAQPIGYSRYIFNIDLSKLTEKFLETSYFLTINFIIKLFYILSVLLKKTRM